MNYKVKISTISILSFLSLLSCTYLGSDNSAKLKPLIDKWNKANNEKNVNLLKEVYADKLNYYGISSDKKKCIEDQELFFKKNPNSYQSIFGDISYEKSNSKSETKCTFIKRVTINNKTKDYPSYLIFTQIGSEYKISSEGDIANIAQNSRIKKQKEEPIGLTLEGDFNGDGQKEKLLYVFIASKTLENNFVHGVTKLHCSNPNIKDFKIEEASMGLYSLNNEGDLNGDGGDEIRYTCQWGHGGGQSKTTTILSYKNGKWTKILEFQIDVFGSHRRIEKSKKPNTVIIYPSALGDEGYFTEKKEVRLE